MYTPFAQDDLKPDMQSQQKRDCLGEKKKEARQQLRDFVRPDIRLEQPNPTTVGSNFLWGDLIGSKARVGSYAPSDALLTR